MPVRDRAESQETSARHEGGSRSPPRELPPAGSGGSVDIAAQVAAAFNKQLPDITKRVTAACTDPLQTVCNTACESTVRELKGRLDNLEQGQAKLEEGQGKLAKQMEDLSQKVSTAMDLLSHSASTPILGTPNANSQAHHNFQGAPPGNFTPDVTTSSFYRKPDPTKLFINTKDRVLVARDKVYAAVVTLAGEASIAEDHFDFEGDVLDNRFEMLFKGSSAAPRALQFFQSLQLGRGKWKKQEVMDDLDEVVQFFVQPDKNGAQTRREILAKNLKDIVQPLVGDKQIFVRKTTGSIMVDRRVLATVFINGEHSARIQWFHPKRIALAIEQDVVEQQFAAVVGGPSFS